MASTIIPYVPTIIAPNGGVNSSAGQGMDYQFTLSLTGTSGGQVTIILTDALIGVTTQLGFGFVTGQQPIFCLTFTNKIYVLSGATTFFSAINDPTVWNDPNGIFNGIFNGFVTISNYYSTQSTINSIAVYQGRLAFFADNYIQFYIVDPNPDNWQAAQTLTNTGTFASFSVHSIGDIEVLYLAYTGIRSLRTAETTLNAFVNDIGSPVDLFVQSDLEQSPLATTKYSCSIVDPRTGRYWLFIPNLSSYNGVGKIYVLSYYPSNKIIAWSTYDPSYIADDGTVAYFTPYKFIFYNGQVYARGTDGVIYPFGGTDGNTYDVTTAIAQVPFFDMKYPGHKKKSSAIDVDVSNGQWDVYATPDWINGTLIGVLDSQGTATYDQGWIGFTAEGTHFSVEFISNSASNATISTAQLYYGLCESPVE